MKIELSNNKIFLKHKNLKHEIHPFWLRERLEGEEYIDKGTQQRLFDPSSLNNEININKAKINGDFLEVTFNDGANSKLKISKLAEEFLGQDIDIKSKFEFL